MSYSIKIYFSDSGLDKEYIRKVYFGLKQAGFLPWMYDEDVLPGEEWETAVNETMATANVFLFFLSDNWIETPYRKIELDKARDIQSQRQNGTVLIIPILLKKNSVVPAALQSFRYINFFSDFEQGLDELIQGLKKFDERFKKQFQPAKSIIAVETLRDLYISEIELINIRCFGKLTINLEENDNPIEWAMILGDNSVGKTTLLRSIALGLCNQSDATALMRSIPGGFIRQGNDEGSIKIKLRDTGAKKNNRPVDTNQKELFLRALLNAFPTRRKLFNLFYDLGVDLKNIIDFDGYISFEREVISLIEWAEKTAKLNELIEAARRQSPDNLSLLEFDQDKRTKTYTITTRIIKQSEDTEFISQTIEPDTDFLWSDIFVCGYGSNRTTQTYTNYESYRSIDAVQSLFTSQAQFQNPEVVLLRRDPETRKQIEALLLNILMLDAPEHQIRYTDRGLELEGPWGRQPLQVLSDGYRSTTQWILDFLGWLIQSNRLIDNPNIGGILLIDEIEQHLHPRWQRFIVQRLRKKFPKTQIIASTHTPLVASGIADIDSGVLLKLGQNEEGNTDVRIIDKQWLKGKRADQILTSEAFGLFTSRNPGSQDDVDRYSELLSNSARTAAEEAELQSLRSHIQDAFNDGESEAAQIVRKAVGVALQETVQDISPELIDLELRKQLQQLSPPEA